MQRYCFGLLLLAAASTQAQDPFEIHVYEWYAELNPVEVHQLYPGVDLDLGHNIVWSLGVGAGLTSDSPRLVIKSHLEFEFGRHD